jgi:hypothetical protein
MEPISTFGRHTWQIATPIHMALSGNIGRQERLRGRKSLTVISTAQLAIQTECCSRDMMRNTLFKHQWQSEIDWGFCRWRNLGGINTSWRCRDSESVRAERYEISGQGGNDYQTVKNNKKMFNVIRDSLSDLTWSNHGDYGEYDDDNEKDSEFSMLCEDDKSGWVIDWYSTTVHQCMERCLQ